MVSKKWDCGCNGIGKAAAPFSMHVVWDRSDWARLQHSPVLARARMGMVQPELGHNTYQFT